MYRELVWTDASEEHIGRHAVRADEVEVAVNGRPVLTLRGRDDNTEMYGTTAEGRHLVVI